MSSVIRCGFGAHLEAVVLGMVLVAAVSSSGCSDPSESDPTTPPTITTPPLAVALEIAPPSLDFSSVEVGSSDTQTLTVSNTGSASASVTFSLNPVEAAFVLGATSAEIGPGDSYALTVTFSPTAEATYTSSVLATALEESASASLSGEGTEPDVTPDDLDNDGFSVADGDCNDEDDTIHPGAPELCDEQDNDCDNRTDEDAPTWYPDGDGDGVGGSGAALEVCDAGEGYALQDGDCDDSDDGIYPGANEICDGIDQDCDGSEDEGLPTSTYYVDADGDGFGADESVSACGPVDGASALTGDCNDASSGTYPGAVEICDGTDNDCDSEIDEDGASTYYVDQDQDGHGNPSSPLESCDPAGLSALSDDCDDSVATTYTGAEELCDGVDNDCDGEIDDGVAATFYLDGDSDGFGASNGATVACSKPPGYVENAIDCNDSDADINPGASEVCDATDNDCDQTIDEGVQSNLYVDGDEDGFGDTTQPVSACPSTPGLASKPGDCNDQDDLTYPGAIEICDSADNDCDTITDEGVTSSFYTDGDGDGYGSGTPIQTCTAPSGSASQSGDCGDNDNTVYPGAPETCDGKDNDCDSQIDENGETPFYRDFDQDGFGDETVSQVSCNAPAGYVANSSDCNDRDAGIHPNAAESCNSKDDNCNGQVDEGVLTTWYLDADGDGFGRASGSIASCTAPSGDYTSDGGDCNDLDSTIYPGATERCNLKDDDCDSLTDEGVTTTFYVDTDLDTYGSASRTTQACSVPAGYSANSTDCNDSNDTIYPDAPELCDGLDNDCDLQVDEGAKTTYYLDNDGDGYGLTRFTIQACSAPDGYAPLAGDCDDAFDTVYPGATEICDSKDNDCDSVTDEGVTTIYYYDADLDTYGSPGSDVSACSPPNSRYVTNDDDCNDLDANINPGEPEICNGKDDNCDNKTDDVDADQDGHKAIACGGNDCDDNDDYINPLAVEICDGVDDDCDGQVDESDPEIDFDSDSNNCGGCGVVCGENGQGPSCLNGNCGSMPSYQHRWSNLTSIPAASNWTTLTGSSFSLRTSGGPLEIELNIPLIGGGKGTCRPIVDGKWAGFYEGLPETYIWHEGLDTTGYNNGTIKRMFNRTRVYMSIAAGTHTVAVQCRTESGTLTAGRSGATALVLTREYLGDNRVYQMVSLQGTTMGATGSMVKLPGSDLTVTTTTSKLEITISVPIGNGGHAGCLEWMDGAVIPANPAYSNGFWYAGLEPTYYGWVQWHHTRTYTSITPGTHTFSIRCYNDSGTLNIGQADTASVIIVRELDEALYPSSQAVDAYANGWDISNGTDSRWYAMPNYSTTMTVVRGNLDIGYHVSYHNVAANQYFTCRPLVDGVWAGSAAGLTFVSNEEEGSEHEIYSGTGWYGMMTRRRLYTNIAPGTHTISLECLSSGSGYYAGYHTNGTLTVRDVDVIADN